MSHPHPSPVALFALSLALVVSPAAARSIAGCSVFPPDNIWNVPVDHLPLDVRSTAYVASIGTEEPMHPDFGSGVYPPDTGGPIGIPFVVVGGDQPTVPVSFDYDDESDPGPYPIPADAPIEGGPQSDGDRHVVVVDRDACRLYEVYAAYPNGDGSWAAGSGAIFDLGSQELRTDSWTSADAAGLPILPGLVRFDEVAAGEIRHALRFTAPRTRRDHVWPARHDASSLTDATLPPMGQRFRLRANFDESGFAPEVQVILRALKKYGMMLADNGSAWFLSGVPDERWDNDLLRQLRQVHGSDFEAVDVSSLIVDPNSARTSQGVAASTDFFLPQVANGDFGDFRFQTRFIFVGGSAESTVTIDFLDSDGEPLPLRMGDGSSNARLQYVLPQGHSVFLDSSGLGAPQLGYVRVSKSPEVGGSAILSIFDQATGVRLTETAVDFVESRMEFHFALDSIGSADTGVALVHPAGDSLTTNEPATVRVRVYGRDFELLAEETLDDLPAGVHIATFVHQLFSDPRVASQLEEMEGVVTIDSDRPLAALVLRQRDEPGKRYPESVPTLTAFRVYPGILMQGTVSLSDRKTP